MFYRLKKLDEVSLAMIITNDRIKKFFSREQLQEDRVEQLKYLHAQQMVIIERQARSSNLARFKELLNMIDNARNNENNEKQRERNDDNDNDEIEV